MSIQPGRYELGPQNGKLSVRTGKGGVASKAGHNLLIEVGAWTATVQVGAEPAQTRLELTADSRSLRVVEGSGGIQSLGDDEKAGIQQTIDEEVLKGTAISFRSTAVQPAGDGRLSVEGELDLAGRGGPITFDLDVGDDGNLTGSAIIKQTDWKMKPYSALFGTLKVSNEVEVAIKAQLPAGPSEPAHERTSTHG
jgi:polyisoprenoid-binding protein YceI